MAYALIAHDKAKSANDNSVTTAAINMTGADLLVVAVATTGFNAATVTDSLSNTWTAKTRYGTSSATIQLFFVQAPTVGASQTFTATANGEFPSICVAGFSGSATTPFDVENGAQASGVSTIQPGSITPNENSELIITAVGKNGVLTSTVDSPFTLLDDQPGDNLHAIGTAMAYEIQTTATARNPTWTESANGSMGADIVSFKAAGGGAVAKAASLMLMGVG